MPARRVSILSPLAAFWPGRFRRRPCHLRPTRMYSVIHRWITPGTCPDESLSLNFRKSELTPSHSGGFRRAFEAGHGCPGRRLEAGHGFPASAWLVLAPCWPFTASLPKGILPVGGIALPGLQFLHCDAGGGGRRLDGRRARSLQRPARGRGCCPRSRGVEGHVRHDRVPCGPAGAPGWPVRLPCPQRGRSVAGACVGSALAGHLPDRAEGVLRGAETAARVLRGV